MMVVRALDRRTSPELRVIEGSVLRDEMHEGWSRVLVLSEGIHRLIPAFDNGPIREVEQRAAELAYIARRELRRIDGSDAL